MTTQVFQTVFPPANTAVTDQNGAMTNAGMAFWRALYNRTGQGSGIPYLPADSLAATGATQATALQLSADWNNIITIPSGAGVILPPLTQGQMVWVFNNNLASALNVYPPLGATITYQAVTTAVNAPISVSAGSLVACFYFSNTSIVAA